MKDLNQEIIKFDYSQNFTDDDFYNFVSAWEHNGDPSQAILRKEMLYYEEIEVKTRSYK